MDMVMVACKLPNGITLENPMDLTQKVTLKGNNSTRYLEPGSDAVREREYAVTPVNAEFWQMWSAMNTKFAPVESGAIFAAPTQVDVDAMSREFAKRKTGFERKPQHADGVKPASKDDDK